MNEQPDSKLDMKRWAAYSVAGMAALTAGADTAEAEITHIVVNADWSVDDDVYFALDGGASLNFFHPGNNAFLGIYNAANGTQGSLVGQVLGGGSFPYVSNLASGANISTQAFLPAGFGTLVYGGGYANSQFTNTSGFVAFQFDAGSGTQFGWAQLTAAGDAPANTFTIVDYAFGEVGEEVAVGQTVSAIPEPSSLGLLALGAFGVMASRRKRLGLAS